MAVKRKFLQRLAFWFVPLLYGLLSRLLFATCRVHVAGRRHRDQCEAGGPFVVVFWHYSVFSAMELHRAPGKGWAAMVSASEDAEYVARFLERKGFVTVRGSRNRSGVRALKGLVALVRQGFNAVIVADGSQGPARRMQPGALLLAGRSGAPILPMVVAADRYWSFRSWDRTVLPKPFARVMLAYGEPLLVPEKLSADDLERYRQVMEERLNALYAEAWREFGIQGHEG